MVYVRHEHWLTGNVAFPLRMIGKGSIVEMSSSAVSLSRANAAGVAIGGASDITGNAGTIIVGSYRTVRASVSYGTCFRIGRYASATVISALLNGVSVRLFGVSLSVGDIVVCVGSAAEGVNGYKNCRGDFDVGQHGRAKGDGGIGNGSVLVYGHIKHVTTDSANLFLLQEVFFLLREFECGLPVIDCIGLLVQPCSRVDICLIALGTAVGFQRGCNHQKHRE